jgi:hypothetical protein
MTEDICYMAVDGRSGSDSSVDALCAIGSNAKDKFGFGEVTVLSARPPWRSPSNVRVIQIPQLSFAEYSEFVFSRIHAYTDKKFILIYQEDGYALRPEFWDPEFLNYDYIGAPWPTKFPWAAEGFLVGNGGFSLRSRRLCEFCSPLAYPRGASEDMMICTYYKNYLVARGFQFAPVEVAKKFSFEHMFDETHDINACFGFHGKHNLHLVGAAQND